MLILTIQVIYRFWLKMDLEARFIVQKVQRIYVLFFSLIVDICRKKKQKLRTSTDTPNMLLHFHLYTQKDAEEALNYFDTIPFNQQVKLTDEFSFQFLPAGHIIGSSFIRIQHKDYSLLFTGDMGRLHDPVMKAPTVIHDIDYLVVESTYGNRLHEPGHPKDYLKDIINKTALRGGTVVIPSFAVGRAQAMLHYIYLLKKEKSIPDIPVYLDSPMAVNATHILLKHIEDLRLNEDECRQLNDIATYVNTPEESKELDNNSFPKIIISASGMATGGRVLFHIKAYGSDARIRFFLQVTRPKEHAVLEWSRGKRNKNSW